MLNKNEIAFLNGNIYVGNNKKVIASIDAMNIRKDNNVFQKSNSVSNTFFANLHSLGYIPNADLYATVCKMNDEDIISLYKEVIPQIKNSIGVRKYKPMYPNFPKQVIEASKEELFINALVHYWSDGQIIPDYEVEERFPLYEKTKVHTLGVWDENDLCLFFQRKMASAVALSTTDKTSIADFLKEYGNAFIPDEMPNKENKCFVLGNIFKADFPIKDKSAILKTHILTATDLLRVIVALSGGEVSLEGKIRIVNFARSERKIFLSILDGLKNKKNVLEDMKRYSNAWIIVGEKLHPGEYKKQFPNAYHAFDVLRNEKILTFNGEVAKTISKKDYVSAAKLLQSRPGEFARKLDFLLRESSISEGRKIIELFTTVADKVSVNILLQVRAHFGCREEKSLRVFFPKGNVAKCYFVENNVGEILPTISSDIVAVCTKAIQMQLTKKDALGKVYVSPELKTYTVPLVQRNASKSLHTISRGSRIKLPENCKTLRAFLWWKNCPDSRTDIDLSAQLVDENFKSCGALWYGNLTGQGAYHSGDIVSAPKGACEFIDVNIETVKKNKAKYILFSANSFTQQPFVALPECFIGFMSRENLNSGEIFEPKTVQHKIDITSNSKICVPFAFDIESMELIWLDMSNTVSRKARCNNINESRDILLTSFQGFVEANYPNLYDLFCDNALARGTLVEDKEQADVVFDVDEGVTPYDADVIMTEYV